MVEAVPLAPGVTVAGDKLHVAPLGRPEQESATDELNAPPSGLTLTLKLPPWPCLMVAELGLTATAKSMPVPDRLTVWGFPGALSVTLRTPDWAPAEAGAK